MSEEPWVNVTQPPVAQDTGEWVNTERAQTDAKDKPFNLLEYLSQRATIGAANIASSASQSSTGWGSYREDQDKIAVTPEQVQKELLGIDQQKASNKVVKWLGGGAEAVGDPLSWVTPGVGAFTKGTQAYLSGMGSEIGGDFGEQIGGDTGRVIGSVAGAVSLPKAAPVVSVATIGAAGVAKQMYTKWKNIRVDPEAAENAFAAGSAKRFVEKAAVASGGLKQFDDLLDEFSNISQFVTGADTPLFVAAASNPVIRDEIRKQALNPEMRAKINTEVTKIIKQLDDKADTIFGARYTPFNASSLPGVHPGVLKTLERNKQTITEYSDRIDKLSDPLTSRGTTLDLGSSIQNLVESRMTAVRKQISPYYVALTKQAKKENITLPENDVRDIYNYVKNNQVQDIFGKGTDVDKLLLKNFAPSKEGSELIFKEVPFSAVESLKKRINELQRGNLNETEARKLTQLEVVVNKARENLPGNYNQRLKDLDMSYYKQLGIPFGEEGVKAISSAKYASSVAPVLFRNEESLTGFLKVGGKEGLAIAENAMISRAYKEITDATFGLDSKKTARFLRNNEDLLNHLPKAKQLITDSLLDNTQLRTARAEIEVANDVLNKRVADNFLMTTGEPTYASITSKYITDQKYRNKIIRDLSDISPAAAEVARNNIRREIVVNLAERPDAVSFLLRRDNKEAFDSLLGPESQQNMLKMIKLHEAVGKIDVSNLSLPTKQIDLDPISRVFPGISIPFFVSTMRDRISSTFQKAIRLGSKWNVTRAEGKLNEQIAQTLFNPEHLKGIRKMDPIALTINNPISKEILINTFLNTIPASVYLSHIGMKKEEEE